jgi:hypothetical protein
MPHPGTRFADGPSTTLLSVASGQSLLHNLSSVSSNVLCRVYYSQSQDETLKIMTESLKENGSHPNEHEKRENSKSKNSHLP